MLCNAMEYLARYSRIYGPYIRVHFSTPVHTTYVRVSKMHPYIQAVFTPTGSAYRPFEARLDDKIG